MRAMIQDRALAWALLLPLILVSALVLTVACGSNSKPVRSSAAVSNSASSVSVGNRVGNRIKPFTLRLVDGSTVTSADLLSQNQPTMLFFFKKG